MNNQQLQELLEKMTLEEKIGQLLQLSPQFFEGSGNQGEITGPMQDMGIDEEVIKNTGSVLGGSGAKLTRQIQEAHLKKNRLGIPLLFMADVIHGFKTIFPVPLAIGCSWDLELARKSAEIAAKESSVSGVHVTFAPMVDLVRDPRWGRVVETTGEDPYLNSEFSRAFVKGFQGDNNLSEDKDHIAACVKHFAAYGAPEGGRDYNTVNMSERHMREFYLPAYKAAVDEGVEMVMTSFNTVDGIPSSGNKYLMRDILRDEWGFDGVVISDWGAVKELIPHGVAEDEKEAAMKAIQAGVDIEMMTTTYVHHLKSLIEEGLVDEKLVDEAVMRILKLKNKLGLFEDPYRGASEELEKEVILCEEHRKTARELAAKSAVLLKNEGVLPLDASDQKTIALIGPFAQNNDLLGPWSWQGSWEDVITLEMGIKEKVAIDQLLLSKGSNILDGSEEMLQDAIRTAEKADVIIAALGESSDMSGEGGTRADIRLPEVQIRLLKELRKLGKPIVVVLFNGRPLDLHDVIENSDAILEAWFPGTEGGAAIADILFGDVNPSGKLTMSFPYSVGQVPVYYNCYNTGRPFREEEKHNRYVSKYLDIPNDPLFPFGFGLSYTEYEYSDFSLSSSIMTPDQPITASVRVTNIGKVAGEEIVQLYIRDISGEVVRPVKELKGFKKIHLEPGQSGIVEFTITEDMLRYYHSDLSFTSDAGKFEIFVGPNSRDVLQLNFELKK